MHVRNCDILNLAYPARSCNIPSVAGYMTHTYIYTHAISKYSKPIIPYSLPNEIAKAYSLSWVVFLPVTHSMSPLGLVVRGVPAWALNQRKLRIRNNQPKPVSMDCFKGTSARNPWFFISSNVGGWSCVFFPWISWIMFWKLPPQQQRFKSCIRSLIHNHSSQLPPSTSHHPEITIVQHASGLFTLSSLIIH